MSDGAVRLRIEQGIASVVFDRPRNALTWAKYQQLGSICEQLRADNSVRCTLFRGAGGQAFVAGTDIEQFHSFATGEDGLASKSGSMRRSHCWNRFRCQRWR